MPRTAHKRPPPAASTRMPPAAPQSARYEGGLIGIDPGGAVGWAFCPEAPATLPEIELRDGALVLASGRADRLRDPRLESLIGAGVPGFVLPIARLPASTLPFHLSLHAAGQDTLLGPPLLVRDPVELAWLRGAVHGTATITGRLDGIEDGAARGWALDTAWPDAPLLIEILDFDRPIAQGRADQLREDLRAAGLGDGRCAFMIPLPVGLLDAKPHRLTARCLDGSMLTGGPISFGPIELGAVLTRLATLERAVLDLREHSARWTAPDGSAEREILQILAERLDALHALSTRDLRAEIAALRARLPAGPDTKFRAPPGPE